MGAVGLAAIALGLPVYMINCMFAHGLGLGGFCPGTPGFGGERKARGGSGQL